MPSPRAVVALVVGAGVFVTGLRWIVEGGGIAEGELRTEVVSVGDREWTRSGSHKDEGIKKQLLLPGRRSWKDAPAQTIRDFIPEGFTQIARASIAPGSVVEDHSHEKMAECFLVEGCSLEHPPTLSLGGSEPRKLRRQDVFCIPPGLTHRLDNPRDAAEPLVLFNFGVAPDA